MTIINLKKAIIALIDDTPEISELTKLVLEQENYQVECFEKVSDFLTSLKTKKYDLVISDYNMPEMNGIELLQLIPKNTPSILISGEDITDFVSVEELKQNCAVFLEKFDMLYHISPTVDKLLNKEVDLKSVA